MYNHEFLSRLCSSLKPTIKQLYGPLLCPTCFLALQADYPNQLFLKYLISIKWFMEPCLQFLALSMFSIQKSAEKAYSNQLPYFQSIQHFVLSQLNHWYQSVQNWRGIVIGLPLIVLGVCILLINFFNLYYSIFSSKYNRTHCPFCKKPMEIKITALWFKVLSRKDWFSLFSSLTRVFS